MSSEVEAIVNAVREAVREEMSRFFFELLEEVDEEEQKWIESSAGSPEDYKKEEFEEI